MARKIAGYTAGGSRRFTPRAFGNDTDTDPIVVELKTPTERDRRRILAPSSPAVEADLPDVGKVKLQPADDRDVGERAIMACLVSCSNYVATDGQPIDTADRFVEHAESEIFWEVVDEILAASSFTSEEKKTSNGSRSSMPANTPLPDGTAERVDARGSVNLDGATSPATDGRTMSSPAGSHRLTDAPLHGRGTSSPRA